MKAKDIKEEDYLKTGVLGKYKIIEELGRGGMGMVYKAEDTEMHQLVALKIPPRHLAQDSLFVERFLREARVLTYLKHPNIASLMGSGEIKGVHFIAQEYVVGKSLRNRLEEGKIDIEEAINYILQVCAAILHAHRCPQGIIHRDLKPSNILITEDKKVKIIDFGIAKVVSEATLTMTGSLLGTPAYMAPEQFVSTKTIDQRADIWSIGVILYEMFTKKLPFEAKTPVAMIRKICDEFYVIPSPLKFNPGLPGHIEKAIAKALRYDKRERYQAVEEMMAELRGETYQKEIIEYSFNKSYRIGDNINHSVFREVGVVTRIAQKETGLKYVVVDFPKKGLLKLACEVSGK